MTPEQEAAILAIERPHPKLLRYYLISALPTFLGYPFAAVYFYFRYHTMRYRFDAEGISKSWGILFHHQIVLNYGRIQDIHLKSNLVERWLGLATIEVQTASGSGGAEMTIEGLLEYEAVRDFLYNRMRGAKDRHTAAPAPVDAELAALLSGVAAEMRAVRMLLEKKQERGGA